MNLFLENSSNSAETVANRLRKDIRSLDLSPGTRLQPLRDLAVKYDTSYLTMRKAINTLCKKGILSSRRGAGVYILDEECTKGKASGNSKTQTISMVFCGMEQHITTRRLYNRLLYGIEKEAGQLGYDVVISLLRSAEDFQKTEIYDNSAGFLILGDDTLSNLSHIFRERAVVWVMGSDKAWGDQVTYNNKAVGELAAEKFISHGHKHLLCINVDPVVGRQRCDAFAAYAKNHGAEVTYIDEPGSLITNRFEQYVDPKALKKWIDKLVKIDPRPSGVFVVDMAAFPLYNMLVERGIRPGQDVEIACCNWQDNPAFGINYRPFNIDIYAEEIGSMAVRHLEWRLKNPDSRRIAVKIEPAIQED